MGLPHPKQYGRLGARTMLEHAIDALLAAERIERVLVVVAGSDTAFQSLTLKVRVTCSPIGGATRADTVHNGLRELLGTHGAKAQDWVLVHDAARPCLAAAELSRLIDTLEHDDVGGLLAVPLTDTVKKQDGAGRVEATVPREHLWRAVTPQMFRIGALLAALSDPRVRAAATDESAAIEAGGQRPRLVEAFATNIKVTRPEDWPLAEAILRLQGRLG
jgi:2-C-methyl-D-erythritol 4-phosphate cytidylyltransferase